MNVIVIGASGGIGAAIVERISSLYKNASIYATWHTRAPAESQLSSAQWSQLNLCSEPDIISFAEKFNTVHWLINAAGLLHSGAKMPEKSLRQLDPEFFLRNIEVNALPTLLLAKHFESALKHSEPAHFATVSAKVGSIEDNRLGGWHSYRCSKAALNMAIKNISIEWQRRLPNVCVTSLHPGTTDTELSAPFHSNVPAEKLFSQEYTANCLVELLASRDARHTGKFLAYDGEELPW